MGMKEALLAAVDKGYLVQDNQVFGPRGHVLKLIVKKDYPNFKTRTKNGSYCVPVHRFVAYQEWGDEVFAEGIIVRHKDGNKANFCSTNLELGTVQDNSLDIDIETRISRAKHAAAERKLSDATVLSIRNLRKAGRSCATISDWLGISLGSVYKYSK